jgi:molybdopterin-binding protein
LEPDGIMVADDVNANVTLTADLPATRSTWDIPSDVSSTLANISPEEMKLEMGQEFTATLTKPLEPFPVLLPISNPDRVMENVDDLPIAAPKSVTMTEVDEVGLHKADAFATLLEPTRAKGMTEGSKNKAGKVIVMRLPDAMEKYGVKLIVADAFNSPAIR